MKNKIILTFMVLALAGCAEKNPLLKEWNTPFGLPPFAEVSVEDYLPAIKKGIEMHDKELEAITNNPAEPDFENTIAAMDCSGALFNRVYAVFANEELINGTEAVQEVSTEVTPLVSDHFSSISLNDKLFERVKSVYERRDSLSLLPDQMRLVEETYRDFERSGANLPADKKAQLREINARIASLQLQFTQNLLKETAAWTLLIDKEEDLAGLSADFIADAAQRAEAAGHAGKWLVGLDNPSVMPFLQSADNRDLRVKVLDAYSNRCNNNNGSDNKDIVKEIVSLKHQKAVLLGYPTYAAWKIDGSMAGTPESVYALLEQIWPKALEAAGRELADIEALAKEDGITTIHPADWRYYAAKAKAANYAYDEEEVRNYLKFENVRDGIFYVSGRLFGLKFIKLTDVPVPNPEAEAYEVLDADGSSRGVLYMDMFARPGLKGGGAWCSDYRGHRIDKEGNEVKAVVTICGNFPRPSEGKPSLLTADDTETFFHEFGHALAALLSDVRYSSLNNFIADFVEVPSQLNEHWAFEPQVLEVYAKHYETGEVIPMELVEKMGASARYGQGFATTELVAAMLLDMDLYSITDMPENFEPMQFEAKTLADRGLISEILPRYRLPYFLHIFSHGYDAGYYNYMWASVYECDAYKAFKESGDIFSPEVARSYRYDILSHVNEEDAMSLYLRFRGRPATIDALLENRGMK